MLQDGLLWQRQLLRSTLTTIPGRAYRWYIPLCRAYGEIPQLVWMADFRKDRDQAEWIQMKATRVARKTDQTDCYLSFNYIFSFSNYTSSTCEQGTVLCSLWYCAAVAPFLLIVFMNNIHGRGGCYWRLQVTKRRQKKQSSWTYGPIACLGWGLHLIYLKNWNKENCKCPKWTWIIWYFIVSEFYCFWIYACKLLLLALI